ncbi:hypothetical protein GCM10023222_44040 [Saccharopolyspora cebuensis]
MPGLAPVELPRRRGVDLQPHQHAGLVQPPPHEGRGGAERHADEHGDDVDAATRRPAPVRDGLDHDAIVPTGGRGAARGPDVKVDFEIRLF